MQDHSRVHRLRPAQRAAVDGGPQPVDHPQPDDSWADPEAFDRQIRALFTEEEQATMQRLPETPNNRWSPSAANDRRPTIPLAHIGAIALVASLATAAGILGYGHLKAGLDDAAPALRAISGLASVAEPVSGIAAPIASAPAMPAAAVAPPAPGPVPVAAPVGTPAEPPAAAVAPASAPTEVAADPTPDRPAAALPAVAAGQPPRSPDLVTSTGSTVTTDQTPAAAPAPDGTRTVAAAVAPAPAAQPKTLGAISPGEAAAHLNRAASLLESGQVPAARGVLLLLAERGNREAAYRYARTYDPDVLASIGALGVRGDLEIARRYYGIAAAAGHRQAKAALAGR